MASYYEDELTADMLLGGWYDYEPRGHHKHQIWKKRYLVAAWKDFDMMYAELEDLGLSINEDGIIKEERHI